MFIVNKKYERIAKRFSRVMNSIGCEHIAIEENSELLNNPKYYDVENGITIKWMISEAEYWLSCYYESGNCRCDDRFIDEYEYKNWVSETGYLKRLIETLNKYDKDIIVVSNI